MPDSIFSVVDFPAPFGPMNATRSPGSTDSEIASTARTSSCRGAIRSRMRPPTEAAPGRATRKLLVSPTSWIAGADRMAAYLAAGAPGAAANETARLEIDRKSKTPFRKLRKGALINE
jgi:hypothetical protein